MGIKDHDELKKIDSQMDQVIMANLSYMYFGTDPEKAKILQSQQKIKRAAAGSDVFFDGTLSEKQPRLSSKSHSGLSYLSRSNINDQWYKFIFEDKDTLSAIDKS